MLNKEQFTAYVTKYALSAGILEVTAEWREGDTMISYKTSGSSFMQFAHKNDWSRDLESAKARVEVMRTKKIASLHKSIEKMMGLKVEVLKV
jgi:hypothetical protein